MYRLFLFVNNRFILYEIQEKKSEIFCTNHQLDLPVVQDVELVLMISSQHLVIELFSYLKIKFEYII